MDNKLSLAIFPAVVSFPMLDVRTQNLPPDSSHRYLGLSLLSPLILISPATTGCTQDHILAKKHKIISKMFPLTKIINGDLTSPSQHLRFPHAGNQW